MPTLSPQGGFLGTATRLEKFQQVHPHPIIQGRRQRTHLFSVSALASQGCLTMCYKLRDFIQQKQVCSLTVLEPKYLNSRCQQGPALSESTGKGSFPHLFLASGGSQQSLAFLGLYSCIAPISASGRLFSLCRPLCLFFSSYKNTLDLRSIQLNMTSY